MAAPVFSYECKTWIRTQDNIKQLKSVHMAFYGRVLSILRFTLSQMPLLQIRHKTGRGLFSQTQRCCNLDQFGHGMNSKTPAHIALRLAVDVTVITNQKRNLQFPSKSEQLYNYKCRLVSGAWSTPLPELQRGYICVYKRTCSIGKRLCILLTFVQSKGGQTVKMRPTTGFHVAHEIS